MEIINKKLISVSESDLVKGVFHNDEITEIGDDCFKNMPTLKKVVCPKVKTIGNRCFRSNQAMTSAGPFPVLTTMGADCFSYNQAMTSAGPFPVLTTMGAYCFRSNQAMTSAGSFPVLTTMGAYCFSYNQAMTSAGSFPVLTTMGAYCFRSNQAMTSAGSFPVLTTMGAYCFSSNQAMFEISIRKKKLKVTDVDGSCFVVESEKATHGIKIYTGYNLLSMADKKMPCYVAEKDGFKAHGKTPKKAISDMQYKIIAEKLKHDPIKKDTMISLQYYHAVTGACELGIKSWMKENKLTGKSEMKASELLPILEKTKAYGLEKFKQLITF